MLDHSTSFTLPELTPEQLHRFWEKVSKSDACWEWTAHKNAAGYGRVRIAGKDLLAHRVSWCLSWGIIPNGLWVLHHCDNPGCIRPDHLFLGTVQDNVNDMVSKGRQSQGDRHHFRTNPESRPFGHRNGHSTKPQAYDALRGNNHWTRRQPERMNPRPGEKHHAARLTEQQVREMRNRYSSGQETLASLAAEYGVSFQHVSDIVNFKKWKHVEVLS